MSESNFMNLKGFKYSQLLRKAKFRKNIDLTPLDVSLAYERLKKQITDDIFHEDFSESISEKSSLVVTEKNPNTSV